MRARSSPTLVLLAAAVSQALAFPQRPGLSPRQDATPSVDLGYEIHTGTVNVRTLTRSCLVYNLSYMRTAYHSDLTRTIVNWRLLYLQQHPVR